MAVNVQYTRRFLKNFNKRIKPNKKLSNKFDKRVTLFINNPHHPLLRTHQLTGTKQNLHAFSITGDIRVIYQLISPSDAIFIDIGSHNQVY